MRKTNSWANQTGSGGLYSTYGVNPPSSISTTPAIPFTTDTTPDSNTDTYGGSGISMDNVSSPSDNILQSTQAQWQALKQSVDSVINQSNSAITGTTNTTTTESQTKPSVAQPKVSSIEIAVGIGVVVLIGAGIYLSKRYGKKAKK